MASQTEKLWGLWLAVAPTEHISPDPEPEEGEGLPTGLWAPESPHSQVARAGPSPRLTVDPHVLLRLANHWSHWSDTGGKVMSWHAVGTASFRWSTLCQSCFHVAILIREHFLHEGIITETYKLLFSKLPSNVQSEQLYLVVGSHSWCEVGDGKHLKWRVFRDDWGSPHGEAQAWTEGDMGRVRV